MADDPETATAARFSTQPFAVLATRGADQRVDLVPCCFALIGTGPEAAIVSVVDHKPKRHQRLARLANIGRDPNVSLIVDHRDPDDWSNLWWIRVHGLATVVESGPVHDGAVDALAAKYPQYQVTRPTGPVIRVTDLGWSGWTPPRADQR